MEEIIKKIYKRDKISLRKLQLKYVIKYISQYKHFPLLRDFIESHKNTYCYFSFSEYLTCPLYCSEDCLDCNYKKKDSKCYLIFCSTTLTQNEIDFLKNLTNTKEEMRMYSQTFFYEIIFERVHLQKEKKESLSLIDKYYNYIGFYHFKKNVIWENYDKIDEEKLLFMDNFSSLYIINRKFKKEKDIILKTTLKTLQRYINIKLEFSNFSSTNETIDEIDELDIFKNIPISICKGFQEIFQSHIYKDVCNDLIANKCSNPSSLIELKNFQTKRDFYLTKKEIANNIEKIGKKRLNKLSFFQLHFLFCYVKYFNTIFIDELMFLLKAIHMYHFYDSNHKKTQKYIAISCYTEILAINYDSQIARDIRNMLLQLKLPKKQLNQLLNIKTITEKNVIELHNKLVEIYNNKISNYKNAKYPENSIYVKFSEYLPSSWKILEPKDLHKEGVQMHNCIGTYFDKVINGECGLYYGTVNNKRYNAELIYDKERKKLQIRQLFGKFNEPPEECEVKDFKQAVKTFTVKP